MKSLLRPVPLVMVAVLLALLSPSSRARAQESMVLESPTLAGPIVEEMPGETIIDGELSDDLLTPGHDSCGCSLEAMYGYWKPKWRATVEGVLYNRTRPNDRVLNIIQRTAPGNELNTYATSVRTIGFDYVPGGRLVLDRAIYDYTTYVEASYLGIPFWSEQRITDSIVGVQTIITGLPAFNLRPVLEQVVKYRSSLNDAELSLRTDLIEIPFVSVFGGLRYINFSERFEVKEVGAASFTNPARTAIYQGELRQTTTNNFIGFQVGTNAYLRFGQYVKSGVDLKASLGPTFANFENRYSFFNTNGVDSATFPSTTFQTSGHRIKQASGVLEGGWTTSLQLTERVVVRAGYRAVFLAAITLAPEQAVIFPSSLANTGQGNNFLGNVCYHGPFASVEVGWGGPYRK